MESVSQPMTPMVSILMVKRREGESWADCAARYGRQAGVEREVMEAFEDEVRHGVTEQEAAWSAVYGWDAMEIAPPAPERRSGGATKNGTRE